MQGFDDKNWKKNTAEKMYLLIKNNNLLYLSQGLLKGRPSYMRSLQPSKENMQHFNK
jgi:hypothetical protein